MEMHITVKFYYYKYYHNLFCIQLDVNTFDNLDKPLKIEWYYSKNTSLKVSSSYAYHRFVWIEIVLFIGVNIELRETRG
jgi:hypothetical protein